MALESLNLARLFVDGGSGSAELALPSGDYDMSYDVGSGSTAMTLPSSGVYDFTVDGGSGSLTVLVPEAMAVRLTTEGGSGGLNLPNGIFEALGQSDGNQGRWQTDAYNDGTDRVDIFVDIGSGSVTFEQE